MGQQIPPQQEIWFQKEIQEMLARDAQAPPQQHVVVFTGSSIFRLWVTLERDMRPLPVANRAFGGARTWELLHYMDRIILPLKPSIVVYYCGGNDIEYGASAADIAARFADFCRRVHAMLPKTKIFFVSLNRAPQKHKNWPVIDAVNRLAAQHCASDARLAFIDINPGFLDQSGRLRRELYISDGLHFMPDAYKELTRVLRPVLEETWKSSDS